jgi:RNA polymerase sigma-70 factor (ECF subfamily)
MLRAKHREELPLTEDISYLPKEESQVLEAVLSLEEIYRISIHLHYYEGYSLKEIGKLLGVPSGTVGSWLSRGREQLKRMLGGNEYGK